MTTLSDTDRQLIDLMLDNDLPDNECEALLQRLEGDPEAVAYLADRATLHADLGEVVRRQSVAQSAVASALGPAIGALRVGRVFGAPRPVACP